MWLDAHPAVGASDGERGGPFGGIVQQLNERSVVEYARDRRHHCFVERHAPSVRVKAAFVEASVRDAVR
jgi:hypothetical protein